MPEGPNRRYSLGAAIAAWLTLATAVIIETIRSVFFSHPFHTVGFVIWGAATFAVNEWLKIGDRLTEIECKLDAILEKLSKR